MKDSETLPTQAVALPVDDLARRARAARSSSAGWYVQRLAGQLDRAMAQALSPHGLSVRGFAIVMTVLEHDGITQRELGGRFNAPAYAISRAIDELERGGFVERREHPESRRANTLHASAASRDLAPTLFSIIEQVNARLLGGLSPEDARTMMRLLGATWSSNRLAVEEDGTA